jgi:hypothetical protein
MVFHSGLKGQSILSGRCGVKKRREKMDLLDVLETKGEYLTDDENAKGKKKDSGSNEREQRAEGNPNASWTATRQTPAS